MTPAAVPPSPSTPSGTGAYRAMVNWKIIPVFGGTDSRGQLEAVQGGNAINQSESNNTQVQLNGTAPSGGGEVALRLRNIGTAAMVTPELTATLP